MKRVQIYIPDKLLGRIDDLSQKKGISRSELIRQILFAGVDNNV